MKDFTCVGIEVASKLIISVESLSIFLSSSKILPVNKRGNEFMNKSLEFCSQKAKIIIRYVPEITCTKNIWMTYRKIKMVRS